MFERLDSGQKFGVHRVALCCCTVLTFACNILLFQKQDFVLSTKCSLALQDWNNIWVKETMRILAKFPVSCWYSPFSQACRELGSLKEKFALWTQFLPALGPWWQVVPELPVQTPKKQRGFCPQQSFLSWINTFDKDHLEGFHSVTIPSSSSSAAVTVGPSSSRLEPQREESWWRKVQLWKERHSQCHQCPKGRSVLVCRVLAKEDSFSEF